MASLLPSILLLAHFALSVTGAAEPITLSLFPKTIPNLSDCAYEPYTFSCENKTTINNSCCSPTPGGLILQTQFWSTYTGLERKGQKLPQGSWTIHGLWPDNCDGQYDPAPDPALLPDGTVVPAYHGPGVDTFLRDSGREDLLEYMERYWINQGHPNADLWAHEFSKHATCTSTFNKNCYKSYKKHQDVVNYFEAVVRAFQQYPTFDILAAFGIVPSNRTTYHLHDIQNALQSQTGAVPFLGCTLNGTSLSEVWYFSHVWGTEQYGVFKPMDSTTPSTCSTTVWYHERGASSEVGIGGR